MFENIVFRCGKEPTEENVRKWVEEIGDVLHLQLLYSPQLHQKLATPYMNYSCSLKEQKGGHNRKLYCSLAWQVPIEDSNVDSVALQRQVKELSEKMASLKRDRKESGQSSDACLCVCVCMSVQACVTLVQWCLNWQA